MHKIEIEMTFRITFMPFYIVAPSDNNCIVYDMMRGVKKVMCRASNEQMF